MLLDDFLADPQNPHTVSGNTNVRSNALYKTRENFNCYLTPSQAITLARLLLEKAQMLIDHNVDDAAIQVWNQGEDNETIHFGLVQARKGPRQKKKPTVVKATK